MKQLFYLCATLIIACATQTDNPAVQPLEVFTGFNGPEDMIAIPNSDYLLVSEGAKGQLSLFDTRSQHLSALYNAESKEQQPDLPPAGDPSCKQPPAAFYPHGIDFRLFEDGSMRVLAINHASREAVEFFDLQLADGSVSLQWRGCVELGRQYFTNNVAALPDGGFVVTANPPIDADDWDNPWQILRWQPQQGISVLRAFERGSGNGIVGSADGQFIYANDVNQNRVIKIAVVSGEVLQTITLESPDNITRLQDGSLLVSSLPWQEWAQVTYCLRRPNSPCNLAFSLYRVETKTMEKKKIYSHDGEGEFGAATVALEKNGYIYLGSFAGDRIARIVVH